MLFTEIDSNGNIIRSQFVEDIDINEIQLLDTNNRLVADISPNPPEYDPRTEYAERQEPVVGDMVQYIIKKLPITSVIQLDPKITADLITAQQFAKNKNLVGTVQYLLTNYNATTQQDIANIFALDNYLIKVADNQVSEFYQANVKINDVVYAWVSRNVQTNDVIDKYVLTANGLDKYTPDTSQQVVRTNFGGYKTIPDDLKPLLENFKYKDNIKMWSVKNYGFIVEYSKQ